MKGQTKEEVNGGNQVRYKDFSMIEQIKVWIEIRRNGQNEYEQLTPSMQDGGDNKEKEKRYVFSIFMHTFLSFTGL